MSDSRNSLSPTAGRPGTSSDLDALDPGASLGAGGTVTGFDGTVLVTISRHTEHPGSAGEARLVVIDVAGDVDMDTAPLLLAVLTHAVTRNRHVCCDLSRVAFLGAAGVTTFLAASQKAIDTGCAFAVRGVHGASTRVFELTGLDALLASRA